MSICGRGLQFKPASLSEIQCTRFYEINLRKSSYLNKYQIIMFKPIYLDTKYVIFTFRMFKLIYLDMKCMISTVRMFKSTCLDIRCMISTVRKINFM